jgi:hypothetical protein
VPPVLALLPEARAALYKPEAQKKTAEMILCRSVDALSFCFPSAFFLLSFRLPSAFLPPSFRSAVPPFQE